MVNKQIQRGPIMNHLRRKSLLSVFVISSLATLQSCKTRKYNTTLKSTSTGLATSAELTGNMDNYLSLNGTVEKAGDVVFVVTVVDPYWWRKLHKHIRKFRWTNWGLF
jgi:hypothetical protein